ncbi:DUF6884 domain-containing protein [Streptomyces sp. MS2.AVA.5]|uniref:DUF6884 domain-containing protein n=1 Tax=Streptomyces achmelvichensis TaxID=3134111 RepID=A0ACC6Q8X7_9ACTN
MPQQPARSREAGLSWEQRAGLSSAQLHSAGHVPATVRGADLKELDRRGLVELLAGITPGDLDRPCRVPQFRITPAGRLHVAAAPRPHLVVVPCAMRKSGQPVAPAGEMYVGSYHRAARRAACAAAGNEGRVAILSAKFGLVWPSDRILDYDLRAGQPGTISAQTLRRQAHHLAVAGCRVTVLAGSRYAALARQVWSDLQHPLAGARGIGDHLAFFAGQYRAAPAAAPATSSDLVHRSSAPPSVQAPRPGDALPKEPDVPYTPDPALVRRLAAGLLDTARQEIDSALIGEAITDDLLNGVAPENETAADLSAQAFEALQQAVDAAVRSAEVHINWPMTPAA